MIITIVLIAALQTAQTQPKEHATFSGPFSPQFFVTNEQVIAFRPADDLFGARFPARVFNLSTGKLVRTLGSEKEGNVEVVALGKSGTLFYRNSTARLCAIDAAGKKLWDIESRLDKTILSEKHNLLIEFGKTGSRIVDANTGTVVFSTSVPIGNCALRGERVQLTPGLFTEFGKDGKVREVPIPSGSCYIDLRKPKTELWKPGGMLSNTGRFVLVDGAIYNCDDWQRKLLPIGADRQSCFFSPDDRELVLWATGKGAYLVDPESCNTKWRLQTDFDSFVECWFTEKAIVYRAYNDRDEARIEGLSRLSGNRLWTIAISGESEYLHLIEGEKCLAFFLRPAAFFTIANQKRTGPALFLMDCETGGVKASIEAPTGNGLDFSSEGTKNATEIVAIHWFINKFGELHPFDAVPKHFQNGGLVKRTIHCNAVINLRSGEVLRTGADSVRSVEASPDGRFLVCCIEVEGGCKIECYRLRWGAISLVRLNLGVLWSRRNETEYDSVHGAD